MRLRGYQHHAQTPSSPTTPVRSRFAARPFGPLPVLSLTRSQNAREEHQRTSPVQRVAAPGQSTLLNRVSPFEPSLGARIRAATHGGQALDSGIQQRLEDGLGADLSGVRLHTNGEADALARSVAARAFTTGPHIFFRSGVFRPQTRAGMRLLAHEAMHTVQQAAGPVAGTPAPGGVVLSDPGDRFEREADASASAIGAGSAVQRVGSAPPRPHPQTNDNESEVLENLMGPSGHQLSFHASSIGAKTSLSTPTLGDKDATLSPRPIRQGIPKSPVLQRPTIIQRVASAPHSANFQDFLNAQSSHIALPARQADPNYQEALDAAQRLDYVHNLQTPVPLTKELHTVRVADPPVGKAKTYEYIKEYRILRNYLKTIQQPQQRFSHFRWGPLRLGMGTWIKATLFPDAIPVGSTPSVLPKWWQKLQHRTHGGETIYARGHLLNADLGGPGLEYNLVPLTASKSYGANDANRRHNTEIESVVKSAVDRLRDTPGAKIKYEVRANYGSHNRRITTLMYFMIQDLADIIASGGDITLSQAKNKKNKANRNFFEDSSVTSVLNSAIHATWNTKLSKVKEFMEENYDLMQDEDTWVPQSLSYSVSWSEHGTAINRAGIIPVELPTSLTAAYSNFDSSATSTKKKHKTGPKAAKAANPHAANFESFLQSHSTNLYTAGQKHKDALAAARRLDYVHMHSAGARPPLPTASVGKGGVIKPAYVADMRLIRQYLKGLKKNERKAYEPEELSNLRWGDMVGGKGTWVKATLRRGGHAAGSDAHAEPTWYKRLQCRTYKGKTIYVRGHLLNRHLGGPGLDYNLVPLTGSGAYGANDANALHSSSIEGAVKYAYSRMVGNNPTIDEITYNVSATYGNHGRAITTKMGILYNTLHAIAQTNGTSTLAAMETDPVHGPVLTGADMAAAISAVISGDKTKTLQNIDALMKKNLDLMQFEDTEVPLSLTYVAKWSEHGEQITRGGHLPGSTLHIWLPATLKAEFSDKF